ncbi:MAG TPA: DUF3108 domain-containing protein [Burkholderiales bacterium]|nr:DUF3108 domain-containing protein [Burkholderiales bacterium]
MRRSSVLLTSLVAASIATAAALAAPPARVEIAYEVVRDGARVAEVVNRFEHGDGRYRVVETWRGRGVYSLAGRIVRTSHGTVGPAGPRPLEFADERPRRAPSRAEFDWTAGRMTLRRKDETRSEPMPPHVQDRVSYLLALALSPPQGRPALFSVTDGGGVSRYVFEAIGSEQVKVPAGEYEALRIARRPEDAADTRVTELWLARALGGLPVRILLVDRDGTRLDQQAVTVTLP